MKIRLNIDELSVETFATTALGNRRGTIQGHDSDESWMTDCLGAACGNTTECSVNTPHYTMCDFSCEFYCPATQAVGCSERCGGGGGSGGCGGGTGLTCPPDSLCDMTCDGGC